VGTFISSDIAAQFTCQLQPCEEMKYSTADGSLMISNQMIPKYQWVIQNHSLS
jgi:hypothetical protein